MRNRNYQTSINLLIEAGLYQKLKMLAKLKNVSMSKLIREGIILRVAQHEKDNNIIQIKEDNEYECPSSEETSE